MWTKHKQDGFTIVELLIVIVVIAILAAITIVAYNGIQQRARASAASSALDQVAKKLELYKVDNAAYPLTGNLAVAGVSDGTGTTFQYTSTSGTSYCITATVGAVSYFVDSTTQTTPAQGGCNGQTWTGGVVVTNLITNGDFSNGTTGWSGTSNASFSVSSGVGSITPSASTQYAYRTVSLTATSKYYIAGDITLSTASTGINLGFGSGTTPQVFPAPATPGVKQRVSGVVLSNVTGSSTALVIDYRTSGWDMTSFDNIIAINLTTAFGAGNEPTKSQMDAIMQRFPNSWFDGTVTANTVGIL